MSRQTENHVHLSHAGRCSCGPKFAQEDVIKIGLITSLTGSVATWPVCTQCCNHGVDDINAAGGINGRKISLVILDDR